MCNDVSTWSAVVWRQCVVFTECRYQSVLPHYSAVDLLGPVAHHSVLLYTGRGPLDQVNHQTQIHTLTHKQARLIMLVYLCVQRSSENMSMMYKLYIFLIFMVLILPSLGLTRYELMMMMIIVIINKCSFLGGFFTVKYYNSCMLYFFLFYFLMLL